MPLHFNGMVIGVPKESKTHEYRVGITHFGAKELKADDNTILIETGVGEVSGFSVKHYPSPCTTYRKRLKTPIL